MATLSMSVTTAQGTLTLSKTLSADNALRLLSWAKAQYGTGLTDAQAFTALAGGVFDGLRQNVVNHERADASKTAADSVEDVVMT